jgi:hypothetical protein
MPILVLTSAFLVLCALAVGLSAGLQWLVGGMIMLAVVVGVAGGVVLVRVWPLVESKPGLRPELDAIRPLGGPAGLVLLFLALVVFAAIEAYAVGSGIGEGAPPASLALLGMPVILAIVVLRLTALRARRFSQENMRRNTDP